MTDEFEYAGWAIVELMGHRRVAGWVTTAKLGPTACLHVLAPDSPETVDEAGKRLEQLYSSAALYCLTPCTEAKVEDFYGIRPPGELIAAEIVDDLGEDGPPCPRPSCMMVAGHWGACAVAVEEPF